MYDGLLVIDADAHKMENPVVFFDYLDAPYRARLSSRTDRYGQQRLVIRDLDPAHRAGPSSSASSRSPTGRARAPSPRSIPRPRSAASSTASASSTWIARAIDAQVLYGSMTPQLRGDHRSRARRRLHARLQHYIADDCRAVARPALPGRLHLARRRRRGRARGAPLRRGARDDRRARAAEPAGAASGGARTRSRRSACRSTSRHPDFHPILAAAAELDVAARRARLAGRLPAVGDRRAGRHVHPVAHLRAPEPDADGARDVRLRRRLRPLPDAAHGLPRGRLRLGCPTWCTPSTSTGRSASATSTPDAHAARPVRRASCCASAAGTTRSAIRCASCARRCTSTGARQQRAARRRHRRVHLRASRASTTIRSTSSAAARSS